MDSPQKDKISFKKWIVCWISTAITYRIDNSNKMFTSTTFFKYKKRSDFLL